jgi:hypothetical protein
MKSRIGNLRLPGAAWSAQMVRIGTFDHLAFVPAERLGGPACNVLALTDRHQAFARPSQKFGVLRRPILSRFTLRSACRMTMLEKAIQNQCDHCRFLVPRARKLGFIGKFVADQASEPEVGRGAKR